MNPESFVDPVALMKSISIFAELIITCPTSAIAFAVAMSISPSFRRSSVSNK
jgi:hypothetical protein